MLCHGIEENALLYLEGCLSAKKRRRLQAHIRNCGGCGRMFALIAANYHPRLPVKQQELRLWKGISPAISPKEDARRKGSVRRPVGRWILALSLLLALLVATANAQTIFKTYKELTNAMFVDRAVLGSSQITHNGIYSDEEYVSGIYDSHREEIEEQIGWMETAQIENLTFKEDGKVFRVQIAKGVGGNFIRYGFEGYQTFQNEYLRDFDEYYVRILTSNTTQYLSVDELIGAAGVAPVLGYVPQGYGLKRCYKVGDARESLMLEYQNDAGDMLTIALTRGKMASASIGVPETMKAAANLPEASAGETQNAPSANYEELEIGGYQAIYAEENAYGPAGEPRTFRTLSLYLGDGAKLPILRIMSAALDRETMIQVAQNIHIENRDENRIRAADYFKGIQDERVLAHAEEYLDNIRAGLTEFKLKIDGAIEFYRYSHNDVYYIMYREVETDAFSSLIPLPINLDEALLNRFEYANVQVFGRPYTAEKNYALSLVNRRRDSITISMEKRMERMEGLCLTDQLIAHMCGTQNEVKPLFDSAGCLYYLIEPMGRSGLWLLKTMYEEDGMARMYDFYIAKDILADEQALMDFINGL